MPLRSVDGDSALSADEIEAVRRLVGHSIATVERELIRETLVRRGGNRTHAATVLGISIRALRNKIRTYRDLRQVSSGTESLYSAGF